MKNSIELNAWNNEANAQYESWGFYAKRYNELTEEERNQVSIGGRTVGQYLKDNYAMAKARWEHACAMVAKLSA